MLQHNFKFIFMILIFALQAFAESSETHPKDSKEGDAPAVEENYSGSQSQKWTEVQNNLMKLKTRVDAQQNVVESILAVKKTAPNTMSAEQMNNLKKEHEKLQKLNAEYNSLLQEFDYRFPEKGLTSGRSYIRVENQSLEQMETNLSLEGRLKKLDRKIKKQYVTQPDQDETEKESKKKPKVPVGSKGPIGPDVTDKIILQK